MVTPKDRTAVIEPGHGSITYGELHALANQIRDLKTGVAYVPVDPGPRCPGMLISSLIAR